MFFVVVVKWHFAFDEEKCPDGQMSKRNYVDNNDYCDNDPNDDNDDDDDDDDDDDPSDDNDDDDV